MNKSPRKSFVLHLDSLEILDELTDEQAGKLFRAIYFSHIGEAIELDALTRVAFKPFKNQFSRDAEKYLKTVERNRINGLKGGRPAEEDNPPKPKETQGNPVGSSGLKNNPNKADSDSDSDSDNGSGSKKESENGSDKEKTMPSKLDDAREVIDYLNFKTSSNYQVVASNTKLILARISEGRTVGEIKSVIDRQCLEWPPGNNFRKYLRPATLFNATKFNDYFGQLGQPITQEQHNGHSQQSDKDLGAVGRINATIDARARERARLEDLQSGRRPLHEGGIALEEV